MGASTPRPRAAAALPRQHPDAPLPPPDVTPAPILVFGEGHLAQRIRSLAAARGHPVTTLSYRDVHLGDQLASAVEGITRSLESVGLESLRGAYLVDDRDERNLEVLIALLAINRSLPVVASLFNERIAPHLQAAHPHVRILNPAKLAAPTFVQALDVPVTRSLRYAPAPMPPERSEERRVGKECKHWCRSRWSPYH